LIRLRRAVNSRRFGLTLVFAVGVLLRFIALTDAPRGYFHDEAWSAVKARAILSGQAAPQVYFAENNGMDAAHVYGIAALFALTGPLASGSRIVSSLMGSLSILATYWAAWELFAGARRRHALSLIAAFVVATLFWALTTSRSAWHVPWMTLTITLSMAALLRGRRLMRRRWFIVAGLLAGLAQYTYPSARFLPVLIALIALVDLLPQRHRDTEESSVHSASPWFTRLGRSKIASGGGSHAADSRAWEPARLQKLDLLKLINYAALFVVAAIVFAPLGAYFVQNPEWFFARAQQTTDLTTLDVGQNILRTLAGFSFYGDIEGLHNIFGRPALDPILSVFFVVGLITCAVKRQPVHVVLVGWLVVFSLPVVLTVQAPLFRRWTGILPAEAMIVALGAISVVEFVRARPSKSLSENPSGGGSHAAEWLGVAAQPASSKPLARSLAPVVVAALLGISALWSVVDYFGPYVSAPYMFWAYDSGPTQVANYIAARSDATIFLTPASRFYEVIDITLAASGRSPIQSYNGAACAVFPETTTRETEWVVLAEHDTDTLPLVQHVFPSGAMAWSIDSPAGSFARAWRVPANQSARIDLPYRARADLGGKVELVAYAAPSAISTGETMRVTLALKDVSLLDQLYKVFVHVRDENDTVFAQADRVPCDFSLNEADWRPGDIVLETYTITIPPDAPPGEYRVMLGMYQAESGARLPILESELEHTADSVLLGTLAVR
jgi:hypothetical protein